MSSELTAFFLLANCAATLFMVGLIWFVQVVHYPLFAKVGRDQFEGFHALHVDATARVVALPMVSEAITSLVLAWYPPSQDLASACWIGLGLVAVLWVSAATRLVPIHNVLSVGFDHKAHLSLLRSNWVRTAAWSIRGALMLYVSSHTFRGGAGHGS